MKHFTGSAGYSTGTVENAMECFKISHGKPWNIPRVCSARYVPKQPPVCLSSMYPAEQFGIRSVQIATPYRQVQHARYPFQHLTENTGAIGTQVNNLLTIQRYRAQHTLGIFHDVS